MSLLRCGELKEGERQQNNGGQRDDHTDGSRGRGINRPFIVLHLPLLHSRVADFCALYARPSPVFLVTGRKVIGDHKGWFGPQCMCTLPPGDALRRSLNGDPIIPNLSRQCPLRVERGHLPAPSSSRLSTS